jgi:hypothetical protein
MSSNLANDRDSKITYGGFAFVCAFAAFGLMMAGLPFGLGWSLLASFDPSLARQMP